mmetsp:Transcript_18238/g.56558  ORF Transcript_18238/g.56558 Transcript_18238/m.56558 type:complete len:238 (-) Transcript_18238:253-966(-)
MPPTMLLSARLATSMVLSSSSLPHFGSKTSSKRSSKASSASPRSFERLSLAMASARLSAAATPSFSTVVKTTSTAIGAAPITIYIATLDSCCAWSPSPTRPVWRTWLWIMPRATSVKLCMCGVCSPAPLTWRSPSDMCEMRATHGPMPGVSPITRCPSDEMSSAVSGPTPSSATYTMRYAGCALSASLGSTSGCASMRADQSRPEAPLANHVVISSPASSSSISCLPKRRPSCRSQP